ncbi:MAG: Phage portal protein Gp6 [Herbinix sp.]|jgi:hypothetical protein|nr:Phage portal protein Gp6 [Herbinix sp.]
MTIQDYKATFDMPERWFIEEVENRYHRQRIANVINNRDYLQGIHKVLLREDSEYKGKTLVTRKTIIQYAKTILKFHTTYLLGKPVSLSGEETTVKAFNEIYKDGLFDTVDYQILDRVNKYGDAFEYIYIDNGKIKSKVFDSADSYPVYTDQGEYIAFIEHWTDAFSCIGYYNVYYPNSVEYWSNEGGEPRLISTKLNVVGLPIHYHNFSEADYMYGESFLADIKPLLDELEDIISKMGDGVYINLLNPMPVVTGQRIESNIPADATGYCLNLEIGSDYKVVSSDMDYSTIKLYLDSIKSLINDIGCIPSAVGSSTNIANVSEVALSMLFHMATVNATDSQKWLNVGFKERFERFKKILALINKPVSGNIEVEYNISIPVATNELVGNLKTMRDMGAISIDTIMDKSEYIKDVAREKERIAKESNKVEQSDITVI